MKVSFKNAKVFVSMVNAYVQKYPDETKVKVAIQKIAPDIMDIIQDYFPRKREKLDIQFANTDSHGSILYSTNDKGVRTYMFTPQKLVERDEAVEKLANEDLFDVEPFYIADLPPNFDESFRPYFEGFIIEKNEQPAREA